MDCHLLEQTPKGKDRMTTQTLLCSCQCPYFGNPDEEHIYECQCDCGNVMFVCGHCLEAGRRTDCGECSEKLENN